MSEESISTERLSSNPVPVPLIPFIANAGIKIQLKGHKPIDYFEFPVFEDFYDFIVGETNLCAVVVISVSTGKSRTTHRKCLITEELKVLLGILYHVGTIRMIKIEEYWKIYDPIL